MPYGHPGASWALLDTNGVILRRTGYDAAAAALTFRTEASEYPGLEDFIRDNIETVPSDVTALAVFSK